MRQAVEFTLFTAVAAAAHLVVFQGAPNGAAPTSGDGGENSVTLAASTEAISAMVAEWDRPVEALQQVTIPEPVIPIVQQDQPLESFVEPEPTRQVAAPLMAPTLLGADSLPIVDMTVPPPSTLAVATSVRPEERPSRSTEPRSTPSAPAQAAPRQTAAGSGQNQASGIEGAAAAPTQRQSPNPAVMAQWGNGIRAAVERRKRYPAGTRNRGTVTLSIAVSSTGTLSSVVVQRSSGDSVLDQAALSAVRRARFTAAPHGLHSGVHRFSLPITFDP